MGRERQRDCCHQKVPGNSECGYAGSPAGGWAGGRPARPLPRSAGLRRAERGNTARKISQMHLKYRPVRTLNNSELDIHEISENVRRILVVKSIK